MRQSGDRSHRNRAGVIVFDPGKKQILLMYRKQKGKAKYVIPGGGIEPGESIEQAAIREIKEETNLDITLKKELIEIHNPNCTEYYFLAMDFSGKLQLTGEELDRISEENIYRPEWIPLSSLGRIKIPIFPSVIIPVLEKELSQYFHK